MSTIPEEFLKGKESIALSDKEKAVMRANLSSYIANHPGPSGSEALAPGSALKSTLNINNMPIVFAIILLLGGGTSLAAESSLPGDALYGVKTSINENVRGLFAVGEEAEANWQARIVERRLEEGATLEAEGRLDQDLEAELVSEIKAHAEKSQENIAKLEGGGDSQAANEARIRLQLVLDSSEQGALGESVKSLDIKLDVPSAPEVKTEETASSTGAIQDPEITPEASAKTDSSTQVSPSGIKSDGPVSASSVSGSGSVKLETEVKVLETGTVIRR